MHLKELLQENIHKYFVKQYEQQLQEELFRIEHAYEDLYQRREQGQLSTLLEVPTAPKALEDFYLLPMEARGGDLSIPLGDEHSYILFAREGGSISQAIFEAIRCAQREHPEAKVFYCHEDVLGEAGNRMEPRIKAAASPDTLLSHFYLGNLVVVTKEAFAQVPWLGDANWKRNLYHMVFEIVFAGGAYDAKALQLLDQVYYHKKGVDAQQVPGQPYYPKKGVDAQQVPGQPYYPKTGMDAQQEPGEASALKKGESAEEDIFWGYEEDYADQKERVYQRMGFATLRRKDAWGSCAVHPVVEGPLVSIIIPSKDHPEVLRRCIRSIRKHTTYAHYEILVMDNGSSKENRDAYEAMARELQYSYFYEPMEFNFSKMNNLLAKKAKGSYLLLLNDDMEIVQGDWLTLLLGSAALSHVGAVGAKLYYPNTNTMQHIGITNLTEGPVHKLQGAADDQIYYYGVNRVNRNMIGVTAACLMIAKDKFEEAGGLYEGLAVAYNDVDLNFKLLERGYYNLLLNDVILYHHESLSRGNDLLQQEKRARLMKENACLYERHRELRGEDAYYGSWMSGVSNQYEICYPTENKNLAPVQMLPKLTNSIATQLRTKSLTSNEALILSVDHLKQEEAGTVLVDIHLHVRGLDSADYAFALYLVGEKNAYEIPCVRRYRRDVAENLYNEMHVELSGFAARIAKAALPSDHYILWAKASSHLSRQVLWNHAAQPLNLEEAQ